MKNNIATIMNTLSSEYKKVLQSSLDKATKHISDLERGVLSRIDETADILSKTESWLDTTVKDIMDTAESVFKSYSTSLRDNILGGLDNTMNSTMKLLRDYSDEMTNVYSCIGQILHNLGITAKDRINNIASDIEKSINNALPVIAERLKMIQDTINRTLKSVEDAINIEAILENVSRSMSEFVDPFFQKLQEILLTTIETIYPSIEQPAKKTRQKIRRRKQKQDADTEETSQSMDRGASDNRTEKHTRVQTSTIHNILSREVNKLREHITAIIMNSIRNSLEKVKRNIISIIGDAITKTSNDLIWISSELDSRIRLFGDRISTQISELNDMMREKIHETNSAIEKILDTQLNKLKDISNTIKTRYGSLRDAYQKNIEKFSSDSHTLLRDNVERMKNSVKSGISKVTQSISSMKDNISNKLGEFSRAIKDGVTRMGLHMDIMLDKHFTEILNELSGHHDTLNNIIKNTISSIESLFETLGAKLENTFMGLRDNLSQKIVSTTTATLDRVIDNIEKSRNELLGRIGTEHEGLQNALFDRIRNFDKLSEDITEEFRKLENNICSAFGDMKTSIMNIHKSMTEDIRKSIESIEEQFTSSVSTMLDSIDTNTRSVFEDIKTNLRAVSYTHLTLPTTERV